MNPLDFPSRLVLPATTEMPSRMPSGASSGLAGNVSGRSTGLGGAAGIGGSAGRTPFSEALADVSSIARDMTAERVSMAHQLRRIVHTGDLQQMPKLVMRIQDANARQDVMATVLTKTTSGIDQIVKMQ
ncbi:hypothetical protein [Roseateles terrae]|uniref:EscI/YscI/HrpB family type III secretion system inner rod protein n=1 Tax=Roseateles terrae TaxID=431060 RepID=A0ABR6GQQ2_9BURK|nr:hypothetical protein [Roseateles terrae]MBB3194437.1 hypothetical protein [Roseateles terrae]OWQ88264.1 hypothetical protein CDN98_09075 [Roseateles terrae]